MSTEDFTDSRTKKDDSPMALFFKEQAYLRRVLQFIDEREAYLRSNTRSREDESFDLKAAAWEIGRAHV